MYSFGALKGIPCGTLGNTKIWECGIPRVFRITQRSLASPIYTSLKYTSLKDVIRAFAWTKREIVYIKLLLWTWGIVDEDL